ncbi:hypothetical protein BKA58DRAFT_371720 [Alternaria rosae]|uniref:uncharacterized protein n=1 Tax=Alternaria rosae TaxID=1187941 RepID=UPI001E8EC371|nr:uncharacterized protein BKA58DRAFT_371720 [Alternaria rosae]KAH6881522.1 hypothetical protein BKA58DRAFT_371720 [Alternaria rosae]
MDSQIRTQPVSFNNDGWRFAIQAGVYQNHGQIVVDQTSGAELELLPHAVEAPLNAYVRQPEPFCLPGTRISLLEEIYSWANAQDEHCLYWLNGLAGTGKSTIA